MQYKGLFWSATLRSLLSLRRDIGLSDDQDIRILYELSHVELGQCDNEYLNRLLLQLCPDEHQKRIGKSLIGYFDFNKMGNLVVLLTACKNIDDALNVLAIHYRDLFGNDSDFQYIKHSDTAEVSWQPSSHGLAVQMQVYFIFTLCRHLAGRQFDFNSVACSMQGSSTLLLETLSHATFTATENVILVFDKKWVSHPSFYYSAQIVKMLESTLQEPDLLPLKRQIFDVFQSASSPARIRAEWVASQLGQTESSFRRQLRQENVSFSALLKGYIHDKSCQHLVAGEKTEDTAFLLGFADRRSFERSFKEHAGISAGQIRQLGSRMRFHKGNSNLLDVVEHLPPLPETIQSLLALSDEHITLARVVTIIERDPIFQAHVMSKASRGVYGNAPQTLEQAVGRNLGLGNIKHLAVIFAAQQLLTSQCRFKNIQQLTDAMLLSHLLFAKLYGFADIAENDQETVRQLLLFGLLSLFLVFHEDCIIADGALELWEKSDSFDEFCNALNQEFGLCLYGATSLMLLRWGFKNTVNQQLWKLCQAGNQTSLTPIQHHILISHNIAFTEIGFHPADDNTPKYSALAESQIESVNAVLDLWHSPAS